MHLIIACDAELLVHALEHQYVAYSLLAHQHCCEHSIFPAEELMYLIVGAIVYAPKLTFLSYGVVIDLEATGKGAYQHGVIRGGK